MLRTHGIRFATQRLASSSSQARRPGVRVLKTMFGGTVVVTFAGGGMLAYAYLDPEMRHSMEDRFPVLRPVLSQIIGEPKENAMGDLKSKGKAQADFKARQLGEKMLQVGDTAESIKDKAASLIPARKGGSPKSSEDPKDGPPESTILPTSKAKIPDSQIGKAGAPVSHKTVSSKASGAESAKAAKGKSESPHVEADKDDRLKANSKLEKLLNDSMKLCDTSVTGCVNAKSSAQTAIEQHSKLLKAAIESPEIAKKDPEWEAVAEAYDVVSTALENEKRKDSLARQDLNKLRKLIDGGRSSELTAANKILSEASSKLKDLFQKLDQAQNKIVKAREEDKVLLTYKHLVQEGRDMFAKELRSVYPNIDVHAKASTLTEDEINALIAHAALRVDQLRRQLAEQVARQTITVTEALELQKEDLNRSTSEKQREHFEHQANEQYESKLKALNEAHEVDLKTQLRRQVELHEQILAELQEQKELEIARRLEESRLTEKERFYRDVLSSTETLQRIEKALESREEQDSLNRSAKTLWLACQSLMDAILKGRQAARGFEARKKPLANELMAVKEASHDDNFVNSLVSSVSDEALVNGVYTEDDLIQRLTKIRRLCERVALIDENGGTLFQYLLSFIQSWFVFRPRVAYNIEEEIDPETLDTFGIMNRAYYFAHKKEFETAVKLLHLLKGEPARVVESWIKDARIHAETKQVAQLLLSHASAISIRTVY